MPEFKLGKNIDNKAEVLYIPGRTMDGLFPSSLNISLITKEDGSNPDAEIDWQSFNREFSAFIPNVGLKTINGVRRMYIKNFDDLKTILVKYNLGVNNLSFSLIIVRHHRSNQRKKDTYISNLKESSSSLTQDYYVKGASRTSRFLTYKIVNEQDASFQPYILTVYLTLDEEGNIEERPVIVNHSGESYRPNEFTEQEVQLIGTKTYCNQSFLDWIYAKPINSTDDELDVREKDWGAIPHRFYFFGIQFRLKRNGIFYTSAYSNTCLKNWRDIDSGEIFVQESDVYYEP